MKLNVKIKDQTFEVEIADLNARPILATVDGETFEVYPDEAAQPVAPLLGLGGDFGELDQVAERLAAEHLKDAVS